MKEPARRIIDLTLPIQPGMRGVEIRTARVLETHGWNATTLELYSHCGTHMDAPRHFLPGGRTLEAQPLQPCIGPARVLNLTPIAPRELITVERLAPWHEAIQSGDRLILRTDWSKTVGTDDYRNALPRVSLDLARWIVQRGVVLIGVEPPSVADVNNPAELTAVHHVLLGAGVVIVEGLANLDELQSEVVDFVALPLPIVDGDGSPVRAIAMEPAERNDKASLRSRTAYEPPGQPSQLAPPVERA